MNGEPALVGWKMALKPWAVIASVLDSVRGWESSHSSSRAVRRGEPSRIDEQAGDREPLWTLRLQMSKALAGCPDKARASIGRSIASSHTGMELWLLRAGLFQAISIALGESEARSRINALLPLFEGWVPERNRTAI